MSDFVNPNIIETEVRKGNFVPDKALTDVCIANFNTLPYVGRRVFPMVGVAQSAGKYYVFDKADLARLTMKDKPMYGKVDPTTYRYGKDTYAVGVKQVILGVDDFEAVNLTREPMPGAVNPMVGPAMQVAEQMNMYLDWLFGDTFFKTGKWNLELEGIAGGGPAPSSTEFYQWNDNASNPIGDIRKGIEIITKYGRRKPNKLVLGANAYLALVDHADLLERVKYSGAVGSPAVINTNVLAQIFGLEEVMVSETAYNAANPGGTDSYTYALTDDAALLLYAPNAAAINTPSAGMTFTWDMGTGSFMPVRRHDSASIDPMSHASFIEGLMAVDMKVTGQDMAVFYNDIV